MGTSSFQFMRAFPWSVVCLIALVTSGCGKPPQVLGDDECFKTVDALWTAITARSPELLDQSTAELKRLHDTRQLSEVGFIALEKISAKAKSGGWESAASDLRTLIRGQTRPTQGSGAASAP